MPEIVNVPRILAALVDTIAPPVVIFVGKLAGVIALIGRGSLLQATCAAAYV